MRAPIFEATATVTINDLKLEIVGEIYEKPLYPGSESNSRILVIDDIGNQIIGTLVLPGKADKQQLESHMKDVIADPLKYKDETL